MSTFFANWTANETRELSESFSRVVGFGAPKAEQSSIISNTSTNNRIHIPDEDYTPAKLRQEEPSKNNLSSHRLIVNRVTTQPPPSVIYPYNNYQGPVYVPVNCYAQEYSNTQEVHLQAPVPVPPAPIVTTFIRYPTPCCNPGCNFHHGFRYHNIHFYPQPLPRLHRPVNNAVAFVCRLHVEHRLDYEFSCNNQNCIYFRPIIPPPNIRYNTNTSF